MKSEILIRAVAFVVGLLIATSELNDGYSARAWLLWMVLAKLVGIAMIYFATRPFKIKRLNE